MLFPALLCMGFIIATLSGHAQATKNLPYQLVISFVDKDNSFNAGPLKLQTAFANKFLCDSYIQGLVTLLSSKGYPTASVDSVFEKDNITLIHLFLGKQYQWIKLVPGGIEKAAMDESGFKEKDYKGKLLNIQQLLGMQQKILDYYEKKG